jgi:hypothetical protein
MRADCLNIGASAARPELTKTVNQAAVRISKPHPPMPVYSSAVPSVGVEPTKPAV